MPDHSPTIYAVLIGIGKYPNPEHHLDGPGEDVKMVQKILGLIEKRKNAIVKTKVLLHAEADRQSVIESFSFFNQSTEDDICLFYFSGHGSRIPGKFFSDAQNGLIESIVCSDSRLKNGFDLADKEIAYLLHKNILSSKSTVVIMDSCHSGQNSRGAYWKEKKLSDSELTRPIEDFVGWQDYKVEKLEGQNRYTPPHTNHIHLAACAPQEKAREIEVDGKIISAFTFALFEALTNGNSQYSYGELISQIRLRCQQFVQNQTPQLETIGLDTIIKNHTFLGGLWKTKRMTYHLFSDGDSGWKVNAGEMDLIEVGDKAILYKQNTAFEITEVEVNSASIEHPENLEVTNIYPCSIQRKGQPTMRVYCLPHPTKKRNEWIKLLAEKQAENWINVKSPSEATHFLKDHYGKIKCLSKISEQLLWSLTPHPTPDILAATLAYNLNETASFMKVATISNPHSRINLNDLEVTLKVLEPLQNGQHSKPREVNILEDIYLNQLKVNDQTIKPFISLDLTNNSSVNLWASVQILGNGFHDQLKCSTIHHITNRFMQLEQLTPGDNKGMIEYFEGTKYDTIPLHILDDYIDRISTKSVFTLKIWVSTDTFDTDRMNQSGIPIKDDYKFPKGTKKSVDPYEPDWQTFTIQINLEALE